MTTWRPGSQGVEHWLRELSACGHPFDELAATVAFEMLPADLAVALERRDSTISEKFPSYPFDKRLRSQVFVKKCLKTHWSGSVDELMDVLF